MRTLVTSALPYANGPLHLGHLAGAYLPADAYVRYMRSAGAPVLWVCGSDEHGAAISMRAKREGRSEQSIIDTYHALNRDAFAAFGISFDIYHRTSDALHHATSQELFRQLIERGEQFEARTTQQYYDERFGSFLADRFIQGTCPNCGYTDAYGDQCERCGKDLSPNDLIDPRSTLSGEAPVLRETTHWYFRLDRHADWLREYIEHGRLEAVLPEGDHHDPTRWRNHVVGQCLSWLDAGLQPRAYTRDLDWGIAVPEVPGHISADDAAGKVLYVWFDAPIGYISATKAYFAEAAYAKTRQARGHEGHTWEHYWRRPQETRLIHFIGKDNIVFHCLTFQATLRALGEDWVIAENVPANQFLNFEGEKFSKSRGIGITMDEYLDEFASFPNHVDAMRWTLLRGAPENRDADFTWDEFVDYHDKELADKLGNYVNRVVVLIHKYFDGRVPATEAAPSNLEPLERQLGETASAFEEFRLRDAATGAIGFLDWANQELQERAPWKLAKADPADLRIAAALHESAQVCGMIATLFAPLLPDTATRVARLFGGEPLTFAETARRLRDGRELVPTATRVAAPEILFAKIHDRTDRSRLDLVEAQRQKLATALAQSTTPAADPQSASTSSASGGGVAGARAYAPLAPQIEYDDFAKLDIRTGVVVEAAAVPKADKLLRLEVDLGFERRTVVSGIAQHFAPETLAGQRVLVLANLAPRTLRGIESRGMILMADAPGGGLQFVSPPEGAAAGMRVS